MENKFIRIDDVYFRRSTIDAFRFRTDDGLSRKFRLTFTLFFSGVEETFEFEFERECEDEINALQRKLVMAFDPNPNGCNEHILYSFFTE